MSWSNFIFDLNTPKVSTILTTQALQYSSFSQAVSRCENDNICAEDDPCGDPSFYCTLPNYCPVNVPRILTGPRVIGDHSQGDCCQGGGRFGCQRSYWNCPYSQNQYCGIFNDVATCTLGEYGKGSCT